MAIFFSDTFTGSFENITSHVPDIGTNWTQPINIGGCGMRANSTLERSTCGANDGSVLLANASSTPQNVLISVEASSVDNSTNPSFVVCRYQDTNNFYAVQYTTSASTLYVKSGGTWTSLDSGAAVANGSDLEFECSDDSFIFRDDGVDVLTATDSTHSSAGPSGLGIGAIRVSTDDATNQEFDNFSVDELLTDSSGLFGGIVYASGMPGTTTCSHSATTSVCSSVQNDVVATNDFGLTIGIGLLLGMMVASFVAYVFNSRK